MSCRLKLLGLVTLLALPVPGPAPANPQEDICHARARELSGFRGAAPRAETRRGNTSFRLSGSVAVGVSRESGPPSPRAPGGHGAVAQERFEQNRRAEEDVKARNYRKIYDDCMRNR